MRRVNCDTTTEHRVQQSIKDKLQGTEIINPKCTGSVLVELAIELKQIKDEFVATGGEYRSRSATMVTDRSDYSQTGENRAKNSISEITAEIIGQPKPSQATVGKRASKGTILSQGSSTNGAPFKATVMTSSFDSTSPQSGRRSSRRLSALDGTKILEKFNALSQDDLSPEPEIQTSPAKLSRKPTIVCRPPLSNQNSFDDSPAEVLYENEVATALEVDNDLNPREHRLQRQDAKSRKTFKMKRTKTKTTSMRRFVSGRGHLDNSETESNSTESSPTRYGRHSKKHHTEKEVLQLQRTGTGTHWPRAGSPSVARSVEVITENMEERKKTSRPRYIQRSKSHDDPHADIHAPAGTVRGRIARQGARMVRSRSPSSSPVRAQKSPISPPPNTKSMEPAEVPVNVTYVGIPGAGSPPASAQSLKESRNVFRYSLKKQQFKPKEAPIVDTVDSTAGCDRSRVTGNTAYTESVGSIAGHTAEITPSRASDLDTSVQLGHFSPPGYDKPKPVITSPDKKPTGPVSVVQSMISQFTMNDSHKQAENTAPLKKIPPPIPPRTRRPAQIAPPPISPPPTAYPQTPHPPKSPPPISPPPVSPRKHHPPPPISPPTSLSFAPPPVESPTTVRFKSRHRQRPITPPARKKASKYPHAEAPIQFTESPSSPSPATSPDYDQGRNPFVTSPGRSEYSPFDGQTSPDNSDSFKQMYVTSRCSSDESLTEMSSLLKDEEKTHSRSSSVCIYFDGKDIPDTLV